MIFVIIKRLKLIMVFILTNLCTNAPNTYKKELTLSVSTYFWSWIRMRLFPFSKTVNKRQLQVFDVLVT